MGYRDAKNFIDRELSWLAFNMRVMEEALDPNTPLLERLKFLGIVATNLDEFFMIRVSGVQEQMRSNVRRRTLAGLTPAMQFHLINEEAHKQFDLMYKCYREEIVPALEKQKIYILNPQALSNKARKELRARFDREIYPVLTPLAVDSGHPFPRLKGLSLNIIVRLEGKRKTRTGEPLVAIVQVPSVLPRLVAVAPGRDRARFALLEDFILAHLDTLFPGMKVIEAAPFRITRDADVEYRELEADDMLKYIETEIRERERGSAVRLAIDDNASPLLTGFLMTNLNLTEEQVYRVRGPLALNELSAIWKLDGLEHLKEEPFTPSIRRPLKGPGSIFSKIRKGDILLHHPYESFVPVVEFISAAANDPDVLAIKQTLYRTSGDSPIIKSLIEAAENGKQVTALVELKARFDEENNIVWARSLEEAGVHVVYGLVGLKTHSKVALVVRQEKNGIRRYVHLGTGNYNPTTARLYTDAGLFTCDPGFADDASELFNLLTGYARSPKWERMIVAPEDLRGETLRLINQEREKSEKGKPGRIRAKMNSIVDQEIIAELYRASCAGTQIDLCVRGICCLRPGIKGLSENIRVWSIVDRFLEHSRIFIFGEDADRKVYLSSADWMDRNMDRRIEVMFPVLEAATSDRLVNEIWAACAKDNVKARYLGADGRYRRQRIKSGESPYRSQIELLRLEEQLEREDTGHVSIATAKAADSGAGKLLVPPPAPAAPKRPRKTAASRRTKGGTAHRKGRKGRTAEAAPSSSRASAKADSAASDAKTPNPAKDTE
ncbi:MAG: polyphosphate kinase [Candidatus Sumerlaeota bacterium]|nr:polyphosphate kinase [Candidatus Sumerlaeota bacterium]